MCRHGLRLSAMSASSTQGRQPPAQKRPARITVVAVVVAALSLISWLVTGCDDTASTDTAASSSTGGHAAYSPGTATFRTSPARSSAHPSTRPKPSAPATRSRSQSGPSRSGSSQGIPAHALATLKLIDAGKWPEAANAPGTRGGTNFRNNEGLLPRTGSDGRRLRFQEWDVNPKKPGRGRDAERIITADDGSAWYTDDHYRSFKQIRGPN